MSMPKIECTNIDKCCAASSLVQSIALEETAKSGLLTVGLCPTYINILYANFIFTL